MVVADRGTTNAERDRQAQEYDRRNGFEWGRRGLPAHLWLMGARPAAFEEACRAGQAVWRKAHTCPECGVPISSVRAAMEHWKERHAPRKRS